MKYNIREMLIDDINDVIAGEEEIFGESLGYDMLYTELKMNPYAYYFVLEINFYVSKKYQHQGYGSLILKFVIDLVKSCKVPSISLEVRESNKIAISLYEKFGFKYSHTRQNYYKNHENASVMILEV